mgnify:CR=1 FL=1
MLEFDFSSHGAGMIHAYRWEPRASRAAWCRSSTASRSMCRAMPGLRPSSMPTACSSRARTTWATENPTARSPAIFPGGWCAAVDDSMELLRRTQRDYPGVPYFMLGHSMGSFLTRTLLFRYPDAGLRAAVICGTGWQPAPVLAAGLALRGLEKLRLGETGAQQAAGKSDVRRV